MKPITFIADGETKVFHFAFPFFMKSDVIIEVDSAPATNYNLICVKNDLNADIPFIGGKVQFNKPPKQTSVITIKRKLPIKRIVDFQPTKLYNPTDHNQDMNYMFEILKDIQYSVESVISLANGTDNKDAIDAISGQITEILSALDEIKNTPTQPSQPVDVSEINSAIETLTSAINTLNTRCNQLDTKIENLPPATLPVDADYVVDSQLPTAENNYTWYRKYASGWVEQGGIIPKESSHEIEITFPVQMADENYIWAVGISVNSSSEMSYRIISCWGMTTTKMNIRTDTVFRKAWSIRGMSAQAE